MTLVPSLPPTSPSSFPLPPSCHQSHAVEVNCGDSVGCGGHLVFTAQADVEAAWRNSAAGHSAQKGVSSRSTEKVGLKPSLQGWRTRWEIHNIEGTMPVTHAVVKSLRSDMQPSLCAMLGPGEEQVAVVGWGCLSGANGGCSWLCSVFLSWACLTHFLCNLSSRLRSHKMNLFALRYLPFCVGGGVFL